MHRSDFCCWSLEDGSVGSRSFLRRRHSSNTKDETTDEPLANGDLTDRSTLAFLVEGQLNPLNRQDHSREGLGKDSLDGQSQEAVTVECPLGTTTRCAREPHRAKTGNREFSLEEPISQAMLFNIWWVWWGREEKQVFVNIETMPGRFVDKSI